MIALGAHAADKTDPEEQVRHAFKQVVETQFQILLQTRNDARNEGERLEIPDPDVRVHKQRQAHTLRDQAGGGGSSGWIKAHGQQLVLEDDEQVVVRWDDHPWLQARRLVVAHQALEGFDEDVSWDVEVGGPSGSRKAGGEGGQVAWGLVVVLPSEDLLVREHFTAPLSGHVELWTATFKAGAFDVRSGEN